MTSLPRTTPIAPVDLVSPLAWAQSRGTEGLAAFRASHLALLMTLARQRAPWLGAEPVLPSIPDAVVARVHDPEFLRATHELTREAARHGLLPVPVELIWFVGLGPGDHVDALPHPDLPQLVLAVDRLDDELAVQTALARGLALLARWEARGLPTPRPWDRIAVLPEVPLAEWVYAEGLAHHLVAAMHPDIPPHRRLGLARGAYDRIRSREQRLLAALEADLPLPGLEPWARWLDPAPPVAERPEDGRPPRGAIAYLGWRLLEDRVRRVGLAEAVGMPA